MTAAAIDAATGCLLIGGKKVFPLVLSNGPDPTSVAPSGQKGLAEVAASGVTFLRSGVGNWSAEFADAQIAIERKTLDAAAKNGLKCWSWLGSLPNFPLKRGSLKEQVLTQLVETLRQHPGLGAWKGFDEPASAKVPVGGLGRAYDHLHKLDPDHPLVIIQAPRGTAAELKPYAAALDITGADIYPVSYPPGVHAAAANNDLTLVGDLTRKMVRASAGKPVWMTLQIAWSGIIPPAHVPRFPSLHEERFMAYQAIIAGARGLAFFGGHLPQVMRPADVKRGWNWNFWTTVLQPLLAELSSTAVAAALTAPAAAAVQADAKDIELATRQDASFFYVLAVRTGRATSQVTFSGLPAGVAPGEALFEYANNAFRSIPVAAGAFRDWLGPYDARIYRFHRQRR